MAASLPCVVADVLKAIICGRCVICQCLLSAVHSATVQRGTSNSDRARDTKNEPVKRCFTT